MIFVARSLVGALLAVANQQSDDAPKPVIPAHKDSVTVFADGKSNTIENPDPSQRISVRQELLDANPGRPGAPVSIPGLPIETASGGITAPQYFAPGVAGDHGEPVAQFIQLGSYLVPNNLSSNAHGNGYADPNIMVPVIIESVRTDGGAFNVREGNHSVDLSATYGLRTHIQPFGTLTADQRDVDLSLGWDWIALQASYGNGYLERLEHRQQYKVNALRTLDLGRAHKLSILAIAYYGTSKIPGLVPINVPNLHDTIDPRQSDQTHTAELAVNDVWTLTPASQLQFSGFFRTYNLSLLSNFGDGLIRQSEFRTVTGGNTAYIHKFNNHISILTGLDYLREAPRRLDLDRFDPAFEKVTANNVTLNFVTPFVTIDGDIKSWLHYNLGWRRDQIDFDNVDLLNPAGSLHRRVGLNSPKASLALLPPPRLWLPTVSLSFGEAFFSNDPRIGTQGSFGSPVTRAHAYQMVVGKALLGTDVRVTLAHVTKEQSLARIDPDTGLQFDRGPSVNRYITVSARHYFRWGMLQGAVSKADARDVSFGTPTPEAPRLIVDFVGTLDRLPWHLHARAEFEEVGRKPLGDGFVSVPVREFRGALTRSFRDNKLEAGVHFQIASGYSGQSTEIIGVDQVVGVYIPSYATISLSYHFTRHP